MHFSKAFDCLPHHLLLAKTMEYDPNDDAILTLMKSYLSERTQRVKIGHSHGTGPTFLKGVPQGSKLGLVLFNICTNDLYKLFNIIKATLKNYADDNTLSVSDKDPNIVKDILEKEIDTAIDWFARNLMTASPDKLPFIFWPGTSI